MVALAQQGRNLFLGRLHDYLPLHAVRSEIEVEFERATANVEADPPAAVTAACAILEATGQRPPDRHAASMASSNASSAS